MSARLNVSDGRDQQHRRPPALCGDYFRLNEMSFEQLIALAAEYARLVHFYRLDNRPDGDWHTYFSADETILMASILAIDTNKMLAQFEARLQQQPDYHAWFEQDTKQVLLGGYRDQLDSPLLVLRAFDAWVTAVQPMRGHAGQEVRALLDGILRGLKRELAALVKAAPETFFDKSEQVFSPHFFKLTALHQVDPEIVATSAIRHNFHTVTQGVRILQNGIRALLPPSLRSGDHDPGISLLIAFIQMFQKLLERLNRFGDQRIDFYYQKVLGMRPQPQKPDSAFLVIKPTAAARQIQIDAGTEFIGGVDAKQENIIYSADTASTLSDAQVSALHSLYFERRYTGGATSTTGCYHRQFELLQLDSDEREHEKMPAQPLMGAPKPGEPLDAANAAAFGFILSSKVLLMREGERKVQVLFQYRVPSQNTRLPLEGRLKEVLSQVRADPKRTKQETQAIRISDVFVRLFRSMFRISLTTETGWYQVTEYRPEYSGLDPTMPEDCLSIEFVLPASAPPITPYVPAVHGAAYDSQLPLLRFEMTQNEYRYPYDLLADCILHNIRIEVEVKAVRQLLLHKLQVGQLSALAPFMPFGPLPAVGSYMVVGCEEILYKQLRDVSIDVEWTGLPVGLGGFPGYYRGYAEPLKSGDIAASVAVLTDGKWIAAGRKVKLFRYESNDDGSPSNLTSDNNTISLRDTVPFYKPVDGMPAADGSAYQYTSSSMNGLFKITLDSPAGAFVRSTLRCCRALTQNAQQKRLLQPLPNAPYTPQISRIALNYSATATIAFEKNRRANSPSEADSFIHLHPLGWQSMFFSDTRIIRQIPRYTSAGQLFIGVQGKQLRGTLSLYFYLREDSLPMSGIRHANLRWRYLSGNRWRKLEPNQVLEDSTKGFMTSGIVLLQLPEDIDTNNTVMPAGHFWLCVSAEQGVERFCSLYSVYAQAIRVTWRADRGAKPQAVMPAMHINRARENIPGIESVYQVRRSFDGKAAETALQFRVRASERLRHKQRALTASDFEQLILEQFPQVFKVKCFPNLCTAANPAHRVQPGHLLIVAIPYLNRGGHLNQKPTLSGHLVNEIKQYVKQFASPDARISVENPVYEEVQVRCTVKLGSQLNTGRLSEQINQALCDYLSPWNAKGINQHFGWTLRQHDVVSFLLDLGYVEQVTGVSLLQIAPWGKPIDRLFQLRDNALEKRVVQKVIHPSYPWSIAVPMNQHWIVISDKTDAKEATPIGINELKIGSTFIIPNRKTP